ncbi:MAG: hypothetical protein HKN03_13175 [Acidimicrobiales bacterium]|nr:hypothetical protein [Acidimicrobiales bacterium]
MFLSSTHQQSNSTEAEVASRLERWQKPLAAVLAIHGFAHLPGVIVALAAWSDGTSIEYLFGNWTISNSTVLLTAVGMWAALAASFAAVAIAIGTGHRQGLRLLRIAVAASLVACVVALPSAAIGAAINVALLTWLVTLPADANLANADQT